VRTPTWLGYVIQRPEAHCRHHELNVHASNYSDFPIIDMIFGTFQNPREFEGRVGFEERASYGKMLIGVDVSAGNDAGPPSSALARVA
jgi:sterol desaturase/sphingolipid hydroxylase (fatty acid hydroxylase superfamily)